jgi:hypothetical protein
VNVAVLADTHLPRGARRLPDECVRRIRDAELLLHVGDFVSVGALRLLEELAPVLGVWGNMDEPALRELMPQSRIVEVDGARVGLVHVPGPAKDRHARLLSRFPGCDAVVYGHTHVPEVARHRGCWILNPGSPTERRRSPEHTMIELSIDQAQVVPRLVTLSA